MQLAPRYQPLKRTVPRRRRQASWSLSKRRPLCARWPITVADPAGRRRSQL